MTTTQEALQLAEEALESVHGLSGINMSKPLAAIRAARAQQEELNEWAKDQQHWDKVDGAIAWHLIDRHADNWEETGAMMDAWLRANAASALPKQSMPEPVAWYVKRHAPGKRDDGMRLGPFWKRDDAEQWVDDRHVLYALVDYSLRSEEREPVAAWSDTQIRRAYQNSPELHKDVSSFEAFKRVAKAIETMHGYAPANNHFVDVAEMVNRFLGWKLPKDFAPDCGISFKRNSECVRPGVWVVYDPVGTNLFTADQAKAMFEYCLQVVTHKPKVDLTDAEILKAFGIKGDIKTTRERVLRDGRAVIAADREKNRA